MSDPTGATADRRLGLGIDPDPLFAELIDAVREVAVEIGATPTDIRSAADAATADRVLLLGRPGRFHDLIASLGREDRPSAGRVIVWTGEPLPTSSGDGDARGSGASRSRRRPPGTTTLARVVRRTRLPGPLDDRRVAFTTERLLRVNLDEIGAAIDHGARIVVTSRDRAAALASFGLPATVVPYGYHIRHAGPLTRVDAGDRPVGLVLLGSRASHTRRARVVRRLADHAAAGDLVVADGVWGEARGSLLRRTRVLVDVHRVPGNFVGLRLIVALAAGAVVVTEPMIDPHPFVPGVHYLEASTDDLVRVATDLAADERRRTSIVEAGQVLLAGPLAMRASLERVLASSR